MSVRNRLLLLPRRVSPPPPACDVSHHESGAINHTWTAKHARQPPRLPMGALFRSPSKSCPPRRRRRRRRWRRRAWRVGQRAERGDGRRSMKKRRGVVFFFHVFSFLRSSRPATHAPTRLPGLLPLLLHLQHQLLLPRHPLPPRFQPFPPPPHDRAPGGRRRRHEAGRRGRPHRKQGAVLASEGGVFGGHVGKPFNGHERARPVAASGAARPRAAEGGRRSPTYCSNDPR